MKTLMIFLTLSIITAINIVLASQETYSKQKSLQLISQIINNFDENGNLVWPQFQISDAPSLVHFNDQTIYAYNLETNDSRWNDLIINNINVKYSPIDYWGITSVLIHPFFSIYNQSGYIFKVDFQGGINYFSFVAFVHERFHRFQMLNWHNVFELAQYNYPDYLNQENVTLSFLENKLLLDYLQTFNVETIKDFLAVHDIRLKRISQDSKNWELYQQLIEGMAEYIHGKTFDVFPLLKDFDYHGFLKDRANKYFTYDLENIIKWRHYVVGGAVGVMLDNLMTYGWKQRVNGGEDIYKILKEKINLSQNEIVNRFELIMKRFNLDDLGQQANKSIYEYKVLIGNIKKQYETNSGIKIIITQKFRNCSGGGVSETTHYLADGSTINLNSDHSTICDNGDWTFKLKTVPINFSRKNEEEFKEERNTVVNIGGKDFTLESLSDLDSIQFNTIKWNGRYSMLQSNKTGIVTHKSDKILITFF